MAIENSHCDCGEKITVRSGDDAKTKLRADGKQVVYTDDVEIKKRRQYDIFRCRACLKPISTSCPAAAYG